MDSPRALFAAGRIDDAAAACRGILSVRMEDGEALRVLGACLLRQDRAAEAVALLSAVPGADAAVRVELASALKTAGLVDDAIGLLWGLVGEADGGTLARIELGLLLADLERAEESASVLRPILNGTDAEARRLLSVACLGRGNAALVGHRPGEAEEWYRAALRADGGLAAAWSNLGNAVVSQGRASEALPHYQRAVALAPDDPNIGCACGYALLTTGNFTEGWRFHECRREVGPMRWNYDRHHDLPQWRDGDSVTGRRMLVMAEQGMGDLIQYVRLASALAERAAGVVLELPRTLHEAFPALPGVDRVIDRDGPAADCDLAVPLSSLPRLLGLTVEGIPVPIPYAAAREDLVARWSGWLASSPGPRRIGLVCSGEARHPNDGLRSIPLAMFAPLVRDVEAGFVLVQTEIRPADRAVRDGLENLRFPGAALTSYVDTAALLAGLDLVISVDTSVAHLAGALGRPVWLLLPHAADYRWMEGLGDSPWYPTMRGFRQGVAGDWGEVLERVRGEVARGGNSNIL